MFKSSSSEPPLEPRCIHLGLVTPWHLTLRVLLRALSTIWNCLVDPFLLALYLHPYAHHLGVSSLRAQASLTAGFSSSPGAWHTVGSHWGFPGLMNERVKPLQEFSTPRMEQDSKKLNSCWKLSVHHQFWPKLCSFVYKAFTKDWLRWRFCTVPQTWDSLLTWPGPYFLPLPMETVRSTSRDSHVRKTRTAVLYIHVRDGWLSVFT